MKESNQKSQVLRKSPFPGAEEFIPSNVRSLKQLRAAASDCRGCDLYKNATQTVFGEGASKALIMFIGEQPGDQEDVQGHPFVGPAGGLLSKALEEAGIERKDVYVTNVVKHFKWTPAPHGKKRVHSKPNAKEIEACRPWLDREISFVLPSVVVLLGATAAQTLLGASFRVTKQRGKIMTDINWAPAVVATVHPSSILRAPDDEERRKQFATFVSDLKVVQRALKEK